MALKGDTSTSPREEVNPLETSILRGERAFRMETPIYSSFLPHPQVLGIL